MRKLATTILVLTICFGSLAQTRNGLGLHAGILQTGIYDMADNEFNFDEYQ